MDILGEAVTAMRSGDPKAARALLHPPWGLRFPSAGAAGVHVVLRGEAWLTAPEEEPLLLRAGEVAVVRRDFEHGLSSDPSVPLEDASADAFDQGAAWPAGTTTGPGEGTILTGGTYYLRSAAPHPLFGGLPRVMKLPREIVGTSNVGAVVELLSAELDSDRPGSSAALPAILDLLLVFSMRTWFMRLDRSAGWARALRDPPVLRVLELIQTRWAEPWTLASLAGEAGVSRATLARRFSGSVGRAPISYLTWWRMSRAAELLRSGTTPIATIAGEVGYADEFTFSKAFRRQIGTAPGAYRRGPIEVQSTPRG